MHSLTLADLCGETALDGGDGSAGAARVAGDEVEAVFSLVELGVGGAAGLACDVFDCVDVSKMLSVLDNNDECAHQYTVSGRSQSASAGNDP